MKQSKFNLETKGPDIEINKPGEVKFWQRPYIGLVVYLLFFAGAWFMWQSASQMAQEEIPYSQFLKYLEQDQVDKAVVTEEMIQGTLKIKDEKSGKPKVFITVPLQNNEFAQLMEKHGVEYSVRHETHWLSSILGWVVPFALLFLLWSWMGKRMSAASGFLNVGNRVRIHPDTLHKVTFNDVAGAEEAKEELGESMASAYTGLAVRSDTAMTGEITLSGLVLPVGGIKEKMLAAHRAGFKRIILPKENEQDLSELPEQVYKDIEFIFADHIKTVFSAAIRSFATSSVSA